MKKTSNFLTLFHRLTEAALLLPVLLLILLGMIWGGTWYLIQAEHANTHNNAHSLSLEQLHTYEAQALRVLREMDQSLKLVKYAYETNAHENILDALNDKGLLPPPILFSVGIVDTNGKMTSSIGWEEMLGTIQPSFLDQLRQDDTLAISDPHKRNAGEDMPLLLGRRLNAPDGSFAGAVVVKTDAAYFVSSYESERLGDQGLMGLMTDAGKFLALRTGGKISYGANFDGAQQIIESSGETVEINSKSLHGIQRYTFARTLYGYPLAVIVGVSTSEQLEKAQQHIDQYLLQALTASIALTLFFAILFYASRQLAQSRQRERESAIMHAAQVERLAYHDTLTGLPNRGLFSKLMQQELMQAKRYNRSLSLLFLDLDHFKYINDTMGHDVGDQLLIQVAQRLGACLRRSDVVARLGGDEFVVLLPDQAINEYAGIVSEKILRAVAEPFKIKEHEFWVTVSIGISTFPQDGTDEPTLMKNADTAMYQAKSQGKNNFKFYSSELSQSMTERLNLEANLRQALQRDEFILHYQCRFNRNGTITGVEALLRWEHPQHGLLMPARFLEAAETIGLTVALGKWALTTACVQLTAWQKQGLPRLKMAVNLTARQFEDDHLVKDLQKVLTDTGMDPALLELEIPQSVLVRNIDFSLQRLQLLKEQGVRIVADDFGEGYSSLATLKTLPLDAISMPRSFMEGNADQPGNLAVATIALGKALGLNVLAKGVENYSQAQFMQMQSCDEIQGFYYNKPMEAGEIEALLRG